MFEPIRGGTRGGQAEFKWSDVSADKDREVRPRPPTLQDCTQTSYDRVVLESFFLDASRITSVTA